MARPLWRGTVGFGLVSIPVEVFTAVRDLGPHFHFLRRSDRSRIGYRKIATADEKPVAKEELVNLLAIIQTKQKRQKPHLEIQQPEADSRVVDLMERLRRSLGAAAGPRTTVRRKGRASRSRRSAHAGARATAAKSRRHARTGKPRAASTRRARSGSRKRAPTRTRARSRKRARA